MDRHEWTNKVAKLAADYRLTEDYEEDHEWLRDFAEELRAIACAAERRADLAQGVRKGR